MSRVIVKNLPKQISEERLRAMFSEMGEITDLKLKYTKKGVFRRFAFVGFKTHTEGERVLKHFDKTFIDTCKIQVDICKKLGDDSGERPWSKYSEKSSAFQKNATKLKEKRKMEKEEEKKDVKRKKSALLEEVENDSGFQEFLEIHKSRNSKNTWSNDGNEMKNEKDGNKMKNEKDESEIKIEEDGSEMKNEKDGKQMKNSNERKRKKDDRGEKNKGGSERENEEDDMIIEETTEASNITLSDMDYLKKKKVQSTEEPDQNNENNNNEKKLRKERKEKVVDAKENEQNPIDNTAANFERKTEFTVKLRGLPFHAKKKDIEEFLSPLECVDIRLPKDAKNRPSGRAYVDVKSKADLKIALSRHKDYIKGRYIEVFEDKRIVKDDKQENNEPAWMNNARELAENEEYSIAETGRVYLRNLSYTCNEEDLLELFSKFGPTTEVFMPVDNHTNQPKGFAFITFMMPEHALQAFNELDGEVFQGRMLHILPAKPKRNPETGETMESVSSFKKIQNEKISKLKNKDHNWNTLFLGVNAVAEIMAQKYNSKKSDILDVQSKDGLALRMALGETQIVAETKEFLTENGVKLDAFGNPESKRSKKVIVVKNLQKGTNVEDLEKLFSSFGHLSRVLLPPSGVTALVEFFKLSSAANAFEKIAYTKFNNAPLYLEWAPHDVFDSEVTGKDDKVQTEEKGNADEIESGSENEEVESSGHVVFVKNLNFETREDDLKQLFTDVGKVKNVTIAKKKDIKNKGTFLSMGYGFVEFKSKKDALNAVKQLQSYELDGHKLNLKMSNRKQPEETSQRKASGSTKQKSSKILVRNVPFEATQKEIRELFGTFGELKTVRLPKKMSGTGPHRGFAFIDFVTKQDAKRAFKSLCTSTHLYGRRLVLEWAEDNESVEEIRKKTADYFHEAVKKTTTKSLAEDLDNQSK